MRTYKGHIISFTDPSSNTYDILDIAHALSLSTRYNGQCTTFYSIAEHSLHTSLLLELSQPHKNSIERLSTLKSSLHALLHDASEAYLSDIVTPFKELLPDYLGIEAQFETALSLTFNIPASKTPLIDFYDFELYKHESNILLPFAPKQHVDHLVIRHIKIHNHTPSTAETLFLKRYYELQIQIHQLEKGL